MAESVKYRAAFTRWFSNLNKTQRTVLGVDYVGGLDPTYERIFSTREGAEFWLMQAKVMLGHVEDVVLERITTEEIASDG